MPTIDALDRRDLPSASPATAALGGRTPGLVPASNDSRSEAVDLGSIRGTETRTGQVGGSDSRDYYRFEAKRGRLEVRLTGLSADLDFELLDSRGDRIGSAARNPGSRSESKGYTLGGGTYYVKVYPGVDDARSDYSLSLKSTPASSPGASGSGGGASTASDPVKVVGRVLRITGDGDGNDVVVTRSGGKFRVRVETVLSSGFSIVPIKFDKTYPAAKIDEIVFVGNGGDDSFDARGVTIKATAVGGSGRDHAVGRAGKLVADAESVQLTGLPDGTPQTRNTCGPNSAYRVIRSLGGTATYQQIIDRASESSIVSRWALGTTGRTLVDAMNSLRRGLSGRPSFSLKTQSSLEAMFAQLREGNPVVAMVRVSGAEIYSVGGAVGDFLDRIPGVGGVTRHEIPSLHWVAVDGFDRARSLVFFTDTDGGHYQQSFDSFDSNFNWNFGTAQNTILQGLGIVKGTFIA
ncbi:pre-peptidase C-terminal domain-containing protein [Paludisphaera mucosa]|uniref:Pre-peptidase C-terminal domain-containing protein n=1 Tax=Paludisphaera mucosa TaxID=3030827 RepID=A0ABT6FLP6_9BACT|nr:pre-peptidase C-terminal domain-containing protein [Paludisphaera mucosa]MDG3008293.1 pre-peptidase C-terminal domain-containing protein [Paludisphaera mucosa]